MHRPLFPAPLATRGALVAVLGGGAWAVLAAACGPEAPMRPAVDAAMPGAQADRVDSPAAIALLLATPREGGDNLYFLRDGRAVLQRITFDRAAGAFVETIQLRTAEPARFHRLAEALRAGGFPQLPTALAPAEPGNAPERIRVTGTDGRVQEARQWQGRGEAAFGVLRDRLLEERAALETLPVVRRSVSATVPAEPAEAR